MRHIGTGVNGRGAENLMIRNGGNMCADAADGIAHGGAVLDFQTFNGIGIITCPALGCIVQQTRIKASAAGCTGLKQDMREAGGQAVIQLVYAQNIAMEQLALTVSRQGIGKGFGNAAVHIPLDVGNLCFGQDLCHHVIDGIHNLLAGEIQDKLVAAMGSPAVRRTDAPVRMGTEQVGILVDHFRLKPQTKLHAQPVNAFCQTGDAVCQTFRVCYPVAQTGKVIAACAEPAVIQNKQLHTVIFGGFRDFHQLVLVKIEVSSFPVVNQDRAGAVTPVAPCQTLLIQLVEGLAHAIETFGGIDHDGLRGLEVFSRLQLPVELEGIDAHGNTGGIPAVHLYLRKEIAGVYQAEADGLAGKFRGFRALEDDKGVVVVGGGAAGGFHTLDACLQAAGFYMPLPCPCAGEMHEFIVGIRQVKVQAHSGGQVQIHAAVVGEAGAAGDDRAVSE